jgi:hypothetical protein
MPVQFVAPTQVLPLTFAACDVGKRERRTSSESETVKKSFIVF